MNLRLARPALFAVLTALICPLSALAAPLPGLDTTFGQNGRVAVELGAYGSRANAVAVQPDGKIVVAGSSASAAGKDFMLFRLLPDGSLDPGFGQNGTVTAAVSPADDEVLSLALQTDGKIVAAGYSTNDDNNRDFALVRCNPDGSLDTAFGAQGMAVTAVGSSHDEITDVTVQADGGILITGSALDSSSHSVVVLGRYLSNGTPDPQFAEDGFALSIVGNNAQAENVLTAADGRILVSGSYSDARRTGLMVLGFTAGGQIDANFGEKGVAVPADSSVFSEGYGMFLQEDGKILVAGSVGKEGERDAALFRFSANGGPDSAFGSGGVIVTPVSPKDDVLYDVAAVGELIAATGFKTVDDRREFLLITYKQESAGGGFSAAVANTGSSNGQDISTALAVASDTSVVVAGESADGSNSSAVVNKYTMAAADSGTAAADAGGGGTGVGTAETGNRYVLTGDPSEVTRTTAVIPAEVLAGLGGSTERGIVFSTMHNPVKKNASSTGGGGGGGGTDTTAPVISNNGSSSSVLSVKTNESATCKYNENNDAEFDAMTGNFDSSDGKTHKASISLSEDRTYYVRCKDAAGNKNTSGTKITVTVPTSFLPSEPRLLLAASEQAVSAAFKTAGDFFVSTALAQTAETGTNTSSNNTNTSSNNSNTSSSDSKDTEEFLEEGSTSEGSGTGAFSSKLTNLKPGTLFYARAYAVYNSTVYYGNEVSFQTADSCVVATAAFGSFLHPSVQVLREFRDRFMIGNSLGRAFVRFYYRHSPPLADVISTHQELRSAAKLFLLPVVGSAWLTVHFGLLPFAVVGLLFCLLGLWPAKRRPQEA